MGQLSGLTIIRASVDYRGQPIELRGLTAEDVIRAAHDFGPQLALLFGKISTGDMVADGDVKKTIAHLSTEFPGVIAACIALAADDYPSGVENARKLPVAVQIECVEAVFNETFYSEAELEKFMESLSRLMEAGSGALTKWMQTSPAGISGSAES